MDLGAMVRQAATGDLDAFGEVTRRFQHMAFGYALAIVHGFQEAEDIVQDAFVAAWYALPTLAEPAAFVGWLRAIVRHQAHRRLRRRHLELVPLTTAERVPAEAIPADRRLESFRHPNSFTRPKPALENGMPTVAAVVVSARRH